MTSVRTITHGECKVVQGTIEVQERIRNKKYSLQNVTRKLPILPNVNRIINRTNAVPVMQSDFMKLKWRKKSRSSIERPSSRISVET